MDHWLPYYYVRLDSRRLGPIWFHPILQSRSASGRAPVESLFYDLTTGPTVALTIKKQRVLRNCKHVTRTAIYTDLVG